jgi:hypothetical protein
MLDDFDKLADSKINTALSAIDMQLWNRAHLKALKLASLLAVGRSFHTPTISETEALWAVTFTKFEIGNTVKRFADGKTGHGDHRIEADIRQVIIDYFDMTDKQKLNYHVPASLLNTEIVPYTFIHKRCKMLKSVRNGHYNGAFQALKLTVEHMVNAGVLVKMPPLQAQQKLGISTDLFIRGPSW